MFKNHLAHYISLALILIAGFLLAYNSSDKEFQLLVTVVTASFYVLWGVLHHHINHDLTPKIVLEYSLMAGLGISLVFFILKGGFGL